MLSHIIILSLLFYNFIVNDYQINMIIIPKVNVKLGTLESEFSKV